MTPHPDSADVSVPRKTEVGGLRLLALTLADVDQGYATVMAAGAACSPATGGTD